MNTTRKILGILLIVAIVGAMLISSVAAAPVTVKTIDESGALSGSIAAPVGIPSTAKSIDYLSDRDAPASKTENVDINFNELNGNLFIAFYAPEYNSKQAVSKDQTKTVTIKDQSVDLTYGKVYLGGYATNYAKGIAVKGNTASPTVDLVYATNGANYFYSVVGGTGNQICNTAAAMNPNGDYKISFTVLGGNSADGQFTELAKTDGLYWWYTAEFNVDISAYSYIKLSYTWTYTGSGTAATDPTVNAFWGNACVYNVDTNTPTTGTTTGTTTGGSNNNDTPLQDC